MNLREKIVNVLTIIAPTLTVLQLGLTTIQGMSATLMVALTAILMFGVQLVTLWKQKLSEEIRDEAIWPTIILLVVSAAGLVNQYLVDILPITIFWGSVIRLGISAISTLLNNLSKVIWPTPLTKSKI
jgi:uncharacterized membrane-anchored protein